MKLSVNMSVDRRKSSINQQPSFRNRPSTYLSISTHKDDQATNSMVDLSDHLCMGYLFDQSNDSNRNKSTVDDPSTNRLNQGRQ